MNKVNFNAFKNIHASEELIQKTLALPKTVEKPPAVLPRYRRSRTIAAAASIMLVVMAGVSVYFFFGNKKPPVAFVEKEVTSTTVPTENGTVSASEEASEPFASELTEATENTAQSKSVDRSAEEKSQQAIQSGPPQVMIEQPTTVIFVEKVNDDPVRPDQSATEQPDDISQTPVEKPTQMPVAKPTEKPESPIIEPIEQSTDAPQPTDAPHRTDLAPVGMMIPLSNYNDSDQIFCRLSNSEGRVLGSPDLFDESHRVYFTTGSGYLLLSYSLNAIDEPIPAGIYTMTFYDAEGNDFYVSSVYLSSGSR